MRVLAITKIFPNSLEPLEAPFNRQQFGELAKLCDLSLLEAIPHFPGASLTGQPARASKLARLPKRERIDGIDVTYMRQLYLPVVGVPLALPLYIASMKPYLSMIREADIVLASWAYPDGCASIIMAHHLGKPCAVKVHGSDINIVAQMTSARALLKRILPKADAAISVSRQLSDELASLGLVRSRIHLVANGVSTALFHVRDRRQAREHLGVAHDRPIVLFVGRIEPQKGVDEILDAWETVRARIPEAVLVLVGDGPLKGRVQALQERWGDGLIAPGARPLAEVAEWLGACDAFTLPSWKEGTPNVVLEALASGRPVVGSRVGGIPDILADERSGLLVPAHDANALAKALIEVLSKKWDPSQVSACGPKSWAHSAAELHGVLQACCEDKRG